MEKRQIEADLEVSTRINSMLLVGRCGAAEATNSLKIKMEAVSWS